MSKAAAYIKIIAFIAAVLTVMQIAVFANRPDGSFFVLDKAEVISEELEADIIEKGEVILAQSGCRFAVAAVDFLGGMEIEQFCRDLYMENDMGNNGVLFVVSVAEENYCIVQGEELKAKLSDDDLKEMLDKYFEQPFEAGEHQAAIKALHDEIVEKLENIFSITADKERYELKLKEIELANQKTAKTMKQYKILMTAVIFIAFLFAVRMIVSLYFYLKRKKR